MSNALAIAAVTSTIRYVLERALAAPHPGPVGGAAVRTLRLDQLSTGDLAGTAGLNLLLYQVTPNHAGNLTDLPTRDASGALRRRPNAALDLHYLLTAFGDEASLEGQRLLARAVVALAATPVLTRDVVADLVVADADILFGVPEELAPEAPQTPVVAPDPTGAARLG